MRLATLDIFEADKAWAKEARPSTVKTVEGRLKRVAEALADAEWLGDRFSIADILMVTVIRNLDHTDILSGFPNLVAYKARGEARPAFQQALADQIDGLGEPVKIPQPA